MFDPISDYLLPRIPEISYVLSSVFVIFASDFIMEFILIGWLRKLGFVTRTAFFLLYALLALPALTTVGAYLLRTRVLDRYQGWLLLELAISFLVVGLLLSARYHMKMKLKVKLKVR